MNKDNYISGIEINLQKIIDYIFQDISKSEENQMEDFLDNHEDLAATIEDLLDFCLEHQFNHFMVRNFERTGASPALNELFDTIDYQLELIYNQTQTEIENKNEIVSAIVTETITPANPIKNKNTTAIKKAKKIFKALFTILLVMNMPFWNSTGSYNSSNLLKASQKEKIQQTMTLSDYQIRYMRIDMLDDRPITEFITDVAIPSNFEMRYVTED